MSEIINDEKYISIPYDIWLSKYKPLEEENILLLRKVEDSKVKVDIVLDTYSRFSHNRYSSTLGVLKFEIKKGWAVQIDNFSELEREIRDIIERVKPNAVLTRSEYEETNKMYEEYLKTKKKNEEMIAGIPRIIKFIFGIKEIK